MGILILFFLSGATALVYEVLWSKYLTLMFGSTVQAQTVVLAVFMGGLALGNRIFGGRSDRAAHPLAIYGYLEVAIGIYGFFFSSFYKVVDKFFASAGSNLLDHTFSLLMLKGSLSALLLLGPTILMGGTLPLLAAWLQRNTSDAGRRSARFYSTNSLGAVCGAGLAGFFLVQWLGIPVTLQMTGLVNVFIGFIAIGISKSHESRPSPIKPAMETAKPSEAEAQATAALFRRSCLLVALTGAVSMGLEVLASRCLCLIFGASLQAFAIMLMAFILGIGLGSAVIASPRRKNWPPEITTIILLLVAASLIGLLVVNIENLVEMYRYVRSGLARSVMGYRYYELFAAVVSILVLGLPAAALGSVLPLCIRGLPEGAVFGNRVGRLLTWNTLGAVVGVLLAGFVLMPYLGLRGSFGALSLVLGLAAVYLAWKAWYRMEMLVAIVICSLLIVACATGRENWRLVLSSGIFRVHETEVYKDAMKDRRRDIKLLFYEDAADATVSVETSGPGAVALRVNGKPDASSVGDLSTQLLLAYLPLMMKPDSKDVFTFGMGSGITAGAALDLPVETVTVAENCKPVLRAAELFAPWNNGILTNSRSRFRYEDARTVLKLSSKKYDVIIAEPSNPWMVGVGSVFSREFYNLAANRLKPGGLMVQWFHVYEINDGIVELVMRTFASVFPAMEIWDVNGGDIILIGSDRPWKSDKEVYEKFFKMDRTRSQLAAIGIHTPEMLLARQFASQRTAFAITGDGAIQTDDFPVLEYEAPKAFYIGRRAQNLFRFDERTWQVGIMPSEKYSALAGLDITALKSIFAGSYDSVNPDLQQYISMRIEGHFGADFALGLNKGLMPCIFRSPPFIALRPPDSYLTNDIIHRSFDAELALLSTPTNQALALDQMEQILSEPQPEWAQKTRWSSTYYAARGVKAAMGLSKVAQAKRILLRGLQLDPGAPELLYLARIFVREGILQPEEVGPAAPKPKTT